MKPSEDLFQLINSLNMNEKGYFKKNSFEGKYLKLFDEIDKQLQTKKEYDEEQLKKKFEKENLTFTKNYLYHSILENLFNYNKGNSEVIQILQQTGFAEILFKKGLTGQALKMISKAKNLAYNDSLFHLLPSLISLEKMILLSISSQSEFEEGYKKVYDEEKKIYKILENVNEYKYYSDSIAVLISIGDIFRNKADREKADKIVNHSLFRSEDNALSKESKTLFHHTLASYYFSIFDFVNAMKHIKRLLQIIESDQQSFSKNVYNYLITVQNYIYLCIFNNKLIEAEKYLKKAEELLHEKKVPEAYRDMLFVRNFILTLQLLRAKNKFYECTEIIRNSSGRILKMEPTLNPEFNNILWINISTSYFYLGDLDKSLFWLNKILNSSDTESRSDIFCAARIFNMILHYELNNIIHLEYVFKSTYRYLLRKKKLFKFEKVLLDLFKKIPVLKNRMEFISLLKTARAELKEVFKDPYENHVLNSFDFMSWIESKIEGIAIGEYLLRKEIN